MGTGCFAYACVYVCVCARVRVCVRACCVCVHVSGLSVCLSVSVYGCVGPPSDAEKVALIRACTCLLYTPSNEHFGITPLEAMYSGTNAHARWPANNCALSIAGCKGARSVVTRPLGLLGANGGSRIDTLRRYCERPVIAVNSGGPLETIKVRS